VVAKTAHVIEEVVVGREATERTETINETLRGTDVEVEHVGAGTAGLKTAEQERPPGTQSSDDAIVKTPTKSV
jgi:stress response protein YsnF